MFCRLLDQRSHALEREMVGDPNHIMLSFYHIFPCHFFFSHWSTQNASKLSYQMDGCLLEHVFFFRDEATLRAEGSLSD